MMMMEKMTSITTDQNEIVSSIQKLDLKENDILLFNIRTDEQGIPLVSLDTVRQTAKMLGDILENKNVTGLFLLDKICLFSIDDPKKVINELEKCISYIQEAADKVRDIENGKSGEPFAVIDYKSTGLV